MNTSVVAQPTGTIHDDRAASSTQPRPTRSLAALTVGNVLEWYEWSSYAVFAPFIAAAMFSKESSISALLSTLAIFAVGFLFRPLGGIVFGRIADRRGRKYVLVATMMIMATGSLAIGLLPSYSSIGIGASIALLLIRIAQGFAHGGESATASSYVSEIAPPDRRGLWSSVVFVAILGGSVLAYLLGALITTVLDKPEVASWGWRIPFLLGAVFAIVVLFMRRSMEESDVFTAQASGAAPSARDTRIVRKVILLIGTIAGITVAHYTWSSYISTYAISVQGMPAKTVFWVTTASQALALLTLPLWGTLSDRIGRRPIFIAFGIVMAALTIPLRSMITAEPWTLFMASAIAMTLVCSAGSILSAAMAETFPTSMRVLGVGTSYSIAVAVFGGTAPYLNQYLIKEGIPSAASYYVIALCLLTTTAAYFQPETRLKDLRKP